MRRAIIAIGILAAAALAAGCGDDSDPEADAVERTYVRYIEAVKDGDGRKACSLLTPGFASRVADSIALGERKELRGGTCEQAVSQGTLPQLEQVEPELEEIEVDGDRAKGLDPGEGLIGPQEVFFERRDGAWKISRTIFFR